MDFRRVTRQSKSVQVRFLLAELAAGLTFVSIAQAAKAEEAKARNRYRARVAYDTILRFSERVSLTPEQAREVRAKIVSLREHLEDLGESFSPIW